MTHGSRLTTHSSVNESTTEIDAAYGVPDAQRDRLLFDERSFDHFPAIGAAEPRPPFFNGFVLGVVQRLRSQLADLRGTALH